jgi:hypothetical protein
MIEARISEQPPLSEVGVEAERLEAIRHNINKLESKEAQTALARESIGGNAGEANFGKGWKANFKALNVYLNPDTGKIELVGNPQHLSKELMRGLVEATFTFGLFSNLSKGDMKFSKREYIFNVVTGQTEETRFILWESGKNYNIHIASSFEELFFAIKAIGPIKISEKEIVMPQQIIDDIEQVKNGVLAADILTDMYGLRAKVIELMNAKNY